MEEEKKDEKKKGKWTKESAIAFLSRNGHAVGQKQVHLSRNAGIAAFGCADFLKRIYGFEVFNPDKEL